MDVTTSAPRGAGPRGASASAPALKVQGLSKTFPGGKGLRDVDIEIAPGTVRALLGQNGCGKSTLIKVLAGVYQPDAGATAEVLGNELSLGSSRGAREAGLRFIHQDLGLISTLDVTDNLSLGSSYANTGWLSDSRERRRAQRLLDRYGIEIDVRQRLDRLSPAEQTLVAIARALGDDDSSAPRLIVLDEPTAALQSAEVALLFGLIERLKAEGNTVMYVSHRLDEVFAIADDVTVLRDGAVVANRPVAQLDHDSLVELILGRTVEGIEPGQVHRDAPIVLEARDLCGATVETADLTLGRGEIVGITGLLGSGYEDLLFLLAGAKPRERGTIELDGQLVEIADPHAAVSHGIAFAPADRKRLSSIQGWSLRENITLPRVPTGAGRWLGGRAEHRDVKPWLELVRVRHSANSLLSTLSGGNQQRVVLARWLRIDAKVLLLQEPTSGVDTGAKHDIYVALREAAAGGAAVLFSSSDPEELAAVADRVIVMSDGAVTTELSGGSLTVDNLIRASLAVAPQGERA
jgi:ribose transport system ATP-binding protein